MKRLIYSCVVVLMAASLAGCVTSGRDFDQQVITQIEKGKTTKAQVQDWLGSPYERGLEGQIETWTYRFWSGALGGEKRSKALTVWFEKNGRVKTFSYTTDYAPWQISQ
ncbi:MAG: outer membrane protein assembly factor BamE [Nitrospinota bacterium]